MATMRVDRYKWVSHGVLVRLSSVTVTASLRGNHSSGSLGEEPTNSLSAGKCSSGLS